MPRAKSGTAGDVAELRALLLWAREERIILGTVAVGSVTVTVTDLGMSPPTPKKRKDMRAGLLEEYAGPHAAMLKEAGLADDDGDVAAVQ